jgi:hypothetical protein
MTWLRSISVACIGLQVPWNTSRLVTGYSHLRWPDSHYDGQFHFLYTVFDNCLHMFSERMAPFLYTQNTHIACKTAHISYKTKHLIQNELNSSQNCVFNSTHKPNDYLLYMLSTHGCDKCKTLLSCVFCMFSVQWSPRQFVIALTRTCMCTNIYSMYAYSVYSGKKKYENPYPYMDFCINWSSNLSDIHLSHNNRQCA